MAVRKTSRERPGDNWRCQVEIISRTTFLASLNRPIEASGATTCFADARREHRFPGDTDRRLRSQRGLRSLLYLEYKNPDKDISIYINSPGGDITALFTVYDTMKFVRMTSRPSVPAKQLQRRR